MSFSLHLFDGHTIIPLEGSLYMHRWDTNKWPIPHDPVPWSTPKREVDQNIQTREEKWTQRFWLFVTDTMPPSGIDQPR